MVGKIFCFFCFFSFLCALVTGNLQALGIAVLDGAAAAVSVVISLAGIMGLWCGVMGVLTERGIILRFSKLLAPFLRFFFPDSYTPERGGGEIAANLAANLLGVGNAATPFALAALKKMQNFNPTPDTPTRDMLTLTVVNTAPLSLLPTTILALRRASGSQNPFAVVVPIWISSLCCHLLALILSRLFGALKQKGKAKNKHDLGT